jgi:hypothetical protein
LKKDAVFDREIIRLSGVKVKARSFAMPAVTPGAIVEYRWVEQRPLRFYTRLQFQRDFPIQSVKYYIKPLGDLVTLGMKSMTFHANPTPFNKERDGFYSTGMSNVPAFVEEPHMPPEDQVRPWMLLYYSKNDKVTPEKFWKDHGKSVFEENKGAMKINDDVRRAATEAVGEASTPEQKLERILAFCRAKIKNIHDDTTTMTEQERKKLKENNSPADTLKRGYGDGKNIDLLFAAMATAAGFDARIINLPDRGDIFFDPNFPDDYFLNTIDVVVKVNNEWKVYDPSSAYVPAGMLRWQQEGQDGLIADPKDPVFFKTPISPAEKSKQKRTAKLRLGEDGTLEGDVQIEYTGHFAVEQKEEHDEESPSEREKSIHDSVKSRFNAAEVGEIKLENVTDPFKPFVCSYKIRIPGYAERTGKRLFLQTAFFQKGIGQLFPTGTRHHDVYFHYPWSEDDTVTIELPAGFKLDNPEAPAPLGFGEVGKYEVKLSMTTDARALVYTRKLEFSGMIFPKSVYPNLKQVFDAIHQQDNHTITLKQDAANAAVKQ